MTAFQGKQAEAFAPLAGVQVLDFSHVIAGPLASFYLAQLGATVIKVEGREGDVMRNTPRGAQAYAALNHGKQSLRLDLNDAAQKQEALKLAAKADILLDNLRPGALEKHGLGPGTLLATNPKLIYCSVSGFGRAGSGPGSDPGANPWAGRPAYDHVVQAATGMALMAGNEGDPPIKVGFPAIDAATGLLAAFAMLAGLRERDRSGRGMLLDVSMSNAALQLMYPFTCDALTTGNTPPRVGNQGYSGSPAADLFETSDGWIAIGANKPKHVAALLRALKLDDIAADRSIFPDGLVTDGPAAFARAADPAKLKAALAAALRQHPAAALEETLAAQGVPVARLRRLGEFASELRAMPGSCAVQLGEGEASSWSPGLGFGVFQA